MPDESPTGVKRPVREPKKKRTLPARTYLSLWKRFNFLAAPTVYLLRSVEKFFGPSGAVVLLTPLIWLDIARRLVDYPQFKKLRRILPDEFWEGLTPWRHFVRMIGNWDNSVAAYFFCDRLHRPGWSERMQVTGVRPDQLALLKERPLILVHLHTGGYGFLHRWLRAQGFKESCFRWDNPTFINAGWADKIFDSADRLYGLEHVPQMFRPNELRAAMRFLIPGHMLSVAIDAESESADIFSANGHPICLSQGIVRLAAAANALLVPVTVVPKGTLRFEFRFGTPVPDGLVDAANPRPAIQFLLDQLWKEVEADPSLLGWITLLVLDLRSKPNHIPWP